MKQNGVYIITTKIGKVGVPLRNLVRMLNEISKVRVITSQDFLDQYGDDLGVPIEPIGRKKLSPILKILEHPIVQLRIGFKLIARWGEYDKIIFFMGGQKMLLPLIVAKLLRKRSYLLFAGNEVFVEQSTSRLVAGAVSFILKIMLELIDGIILYTPKLIQEWDLNKYRNKISFAYEHHYDFEKYKPTTRVTERKYVGFIGRLEREKGFIEFVKAVKDLKLPVLVGGVGSLKSFVEGSDIRYLGWVNHDDIPQILNNIRLLVVPSYTEGLPNIVLEAMACGTPVLATAVGSVPDIIEDGVTGFLIEDNNPKNLRECILRLYNDIGKLEKVSVNARKSVFKRFTFDKVVEIWRKIIEE